MRRMVWALLLVFAFTIPWEYSLDIGEPIGNIARVAGLLVLLAAVPAVLFRGRVRDPGMVQWLTMVLFFWFCCSYFWTIAQPATLTRLRGYFQVMTTVWLVWEFAESAEDLRDLLRAYVAGSWVLAGLTIASLASAAATGQIRFMPEGQDPNDVARFLDLGFPMATLLLDAESRWAGKLLAAGYLPLGFVGVLLTASRGGFVAALVALGGCGLLMVRGHRRGLLAGAALLPAIAVGFWFLVPHETIWRISTIPQQLEGGDLNQRLNIWQAGWQAFVHAPFFGTGAGTFVYAARLAPADTAHNTALAVAVEGGVTALILASALVVACVRAVTAMPVPIIRIGLGAALLVWAVTSLVATVDESRTTWLLMAMIALAQRIAGETPGALEQCFSGPVRALPAEAGEMA